MAAVPLVSDGDFSALLTLQALIYGIMAGLLPKQLPGLVQEGTAAPGGTVQVQSRCWLVLDSWCTRCDLTHRTEMESLTVSPPRACHKVTGVGVGTRAANPPRGCGSWRVEHNVCHVRASCDGQQGNVTICQTNAPGAGSLRCS